MIADYERQTFSISPSNWTLPLEPDIRAIYSPSFNTTATNNTPIGTPSNSIPTSAPSSSVTIGAIVGVAIGGLTVIIAVVVLLFYLLVLRPRKKAQASMLAKTETYDGLKQELDATESGTENFMSEMEGERTPAELNVDGATRILGQRGELGCGSGNMAAFELPAREPVGAEMMCEGEEGQ